MIPLTSLSVVGRRSWRVFVWRAGQVQSVTSLSHATNLLAQPLSFGEQLCTWSSVRARLLQTHWNQSHRTFFNEFVQVLEIAELQHVMQKPQIWCKNSNALETFPYMTKLYCIRLSSSFLWMFSDVPNFGKNIPKPEKSQLFSLGNPGKSSRIIPRKQPKIHKSLKLIDSVELIDSATTRHKLTAVGKSFLALACSKISTTLWFPIADAW